MLVAASFNRQTIIEHLQQNPVTRHTSSIVYTLYLLHILLHIHFTFL